MKAQLSTYIKTSYQLHPFALLGACLTSVCVAIAVPTLELAVVLLVGMSALELLFGMWRPLLVLSLVYIPLNLLISLLFVLTYGSFVSALPIFVRLLLLGIICIPMCTSSEAHIVRALEGADAPRGITISILICLRFIRVLAHQARLIYRARRTMATRSHKRCSAYRMLLPLLDRTLAIAEALSHSLEMRGFTLAQTHTMSVYKPLAWTNKDSAWVFLIAALNVAVVVLWIF